MIDLSPIVTVSNRYRFIGWNLIWTPVVPHIRFPTDARCHHIFFSSAYNSLGCGYWKSILSIYSPLWRQPCRSLKDTRAWAASHGRPCIKCATSSLSTSFSSLSLPDPCLIVRWYLRILWLLSCNTKTRTHFVDWQPDVGVFALGSVCACHWHLFHQLRHASEFVYVPTLMMFNG